MKLLNQEQQKFWHNTKKWHFGIAPDPYNTDGRWNYNLMSNLVMVEELAKARAENIINRHDIDTLNKGIIELTKQVKKLTKLKKLKK